MSKMSKELKLWAKDDIVPTDLQVLCRKVAKSHDDLLAVCEGFMKEADDGSARFDDPAPDSIFIKAKQAIAKAKQ